MAWRAPSPQPDSLSSLPIYLGYILSPSPFPVSVLFCLCVCVCVCVRVYFLVLASLPFLALPFFSLHILTLAAATAVISRTLQGLIPPFFHSLLSFVFVCCFALFVSLPPSLLLSNSHNSYTYTYIHTARDRACGTCGDPGDV